jgi:hypothetical protein
MSRSVGRTAASERGSNGRNGPFAIISQRAKDIVYINATSTRECTFALGFAREYA